MPALSPSAAGLLDNGRAAWRWWVGELAGMIPRRSNMPAAIRAGQVDIWIAPEETRIERVADGVGQRLVDPRPLHELDQEAWQQLGELVGDQQIRIVLLEPDVYLTRVSFPRAAGGRLRDVVALQLSEISPVRPEGLRWNVAAPTFDGDRMEAVVVMARADRVDAIIDILANNGLVHAQIVAEVGNVTVPLETADRNPLGLRARSPWWLALGLLASIPISTICAASLFNWMDTRTIAALEPQVQEMKRLERRARDVEQLRQAIAPIAREMPASRILDDLAGRLPKDAYAVEAERDQQGRLQFVVEAADPDTVREALDHDALFRFEQVNETAGDDGRMRMVYRGRPR